MTALGIDVGTSNTAAVLAWPDGRTTPLLFDGAPLLPSAVCADGSGALLVGADARTAARTYPERFEPHPKRRIDDGEVLLGATAVAVPDLIGAVLRRVADEARRVAGGTPPSEVTLTHPASWGPPRRAVLLAAAERAGLPVPRLVPEPVAAAATFVARWGTALPVGGNLLVYDLGAGTFDASVVRRTADGYEVSASEGLPDTGGLDIDAAVVAWLGTAYASRDPEAWRALVHPVTADDRRHSRQLWDDVRAAKEMLSRASAAWIHLPTLGVDAPVTREQLEDLARPVLDRTVTATRAALHGAAVPLPDLGGVLLVGGSSRIPAVATLLHRTLGVAPTTVEQPELIVAEGSLAAAPGPGAGQPALTLRAPVTEPGPPDGPAGRRRRRRRSRAALAALAALAGVLAAVLAAVLAVVLLPNRDAPRAAPRRDPATSPATAASASGAPVPSGRPSTAPSTLPAPPSGRPQGPPPSQSPAKLTPTIRKENGLAGPCTLAENTPLTPVSGGAAGRLVNLRLCLYVHNPGSHPPDAGRAYLSWSVGPDDGTGQVGVAYRFAVYRCDGLRVLPPADAPPRDRTASGLRGLGELSTEDATFDGTSGYYAAVSLSSFRFTAGGTAWDTGAEQLRTDCAT